MPEGWGAQVECTGDRIWLHLVGQLEQDIQKTIDSVGKFPVFGGECLDAVIGSVQDAVPVDCQQLHLVLLSNAVCFGP